jgi:cell shape-determining protein MreD
VSEPVRGRVWLLVGVLVVLHFVLHVGFSFVAGAPDLLTVGLMLAAREVGLARAAVLGLVFGLLEDALSVVAFGANTVAMTLIGIGGAGTRDLFVGDSRLFIVSYFWIGKWVRDVLHWVSVGEELRQPFVDHVLIQGAIGGAYAAAVGFALVAVTGLNRTET